MGRRISSSAAMTARKLDAVEGKAPGRAHAARTMPASAGPTMRAMLKIIEFMAMAFIRSRRSSTISTASEWRAGASKELAMPRPTARSDDVPDLQDAGRREERPG